MYHGAYDDILKGRFVCCRGVLKNYHNNTPTPWNIPENSKIMEKGSDFAPLITLFYYMRLPVKISLWTKIALYMQKLVKIGTKTRQILLSFLWSV
jgi:hypothetical protein